MKVIKTSLPAINKENFLNHFKPKPIPKNNGSRAHEQFNLANQMLWNFPPSYHKKWTPQNKLNFLQGKLHEEQISAKEFVEFAWVMPELKDRKTHINNVLNNEGYQQVSWRRTE